MTKTPRQLTKREREKLADSLETRIYDHFDPMFRRVRRDEQRMFRIAVHIENGEIASARKMAERLPFRLWEMMPKRVQKLIDLNATQIFNLRD